MTGHLDKLINFVSMFIGKVRFSNDHFAAIMGYGDLQIGNILISRIYYIEGLGHNLFFGGQFYDSYPEVTLRKHTCFVRNLEGVDLFSGSRGSNLYTILMADMIKSSLICLLSKASKTKSLIWHHRLSHLNFGTINQLAKQGLVKGFPKLKYTKDHLCLACQMGKSKKKTHPHKPKPIFGTKDEALEIIIKKQAQVSLNAICLELVLVTTKVTKPVSVSQTENLLQALAVEASRQKRTFRPGRSQKRFFPISLKSILYLRFVSSYLGFILRMRGATVLVSSVDRTGQSILVFLVLLASLHLLTIILGVRSLAGRVVSWDLYESWEIEWHKVSSHISGAICLTQWFRCEFCFYHLGEGGGWTRGQAMCPDMKISLEFLALFSIRLGNGEYRGGRFPPDERRILYTSFERERLDGILILTVAGLPEQYPLPDGRPNITMEEYIEIWYDEDVHDLRSVETEFPAIVFNDNFSSNETLSCKPTVSFLNNNEIDFRISFDEFDDKDYMVVFDKHSFSYKIISTNDLKTDLENDNEKVNMPLFPSPEPSVSYIDDLDFFKDFENEFPAIVYNDALTSKSDFLTEPTLCPQHIDEFDLKDETSLSEYDEKEQNVLHGSSTQRSEAPLRFEGLQYTDADIADFETSIAERSQAPEKVTVTDLFYLRGRDVGSLNVPYLLARYLRLFASRMKQWVMISGGRRVMQKELPRRLWWHQEVVMRMRRCLRLCHHHLGLRDLAEKEIDDVGEISTIWKSGSVGVLKSQDGCSTHNLAHKLNLENLPSKISGEFLILILLNSRF
ncbi:retrovirus-related pol polyprotein from transposon TNT 1-94 [Tanacetum coccineum]